MLVRNWDSTDALADVASISFVADALLLFLLASRAKDWRWLYVISGLLGLSALLVLVFFEGQQPFRFALVLAGVLGWRGLIDMIVAWAQISGPGRPSGSLGAWLLFVVGALSMILALTALVSRGNSIRIIFVVVCVYALLRGLAMIAVSMRLRAPGV